MLALVMLGCALAAFLLGAFGVQHIRDPAGWLALVLAAACLTFLAGLYRLREWARWGAFAVSLLFLIGLVKASGHLTFWNVLGGLYYLTLALYLPSRAATRAFALARSRWVPRSQRGGAAAEESQRASAGQGR